VAHGHGHYHDRILPVLNREARRMPKSRAAIYARLSKDPDGTKTSTARQERDCRALARARGWNVAEVFLDNDLSAYNGAERPGYRAMLQAVKDGQVGVVIAWANDRLYRRTRDQLELMEAVAAAGGTIATVKDGDLDPGTAEGRMRMGILANVAEFESGRKAERVRAGKLEAARAGRPSGGGRRPFGYKVGGMELDPTEAKIIRKAVADVLAGRTLRSIVVELNDRGVKSSRGGPWRTGTLRRCLMSGRIAGLREHDGEVLGPAVWPAIITPEEHERVVAILGDPARRVSTTNGRTYLLSGIVRCGKCGHPLIGAPRPGGRSYMCKRDPGRRDACGGVRVATEWLNDLITEAVLMRLDSPALGRARKALHKRGPGADLARQLRDDERALEQLSEDHYVARRIGRREFLTARDALARRIEEVRRRLAAETSEGVVAALPGGNLRRWWKSADLDRRRALIAAVVEAVTVAPVGRGQRSTPERVDVTWRA
jgi:site-specific DNA recombinase